MSHPQARPGTTALLTKTLQHVPKTVQHAIRLSVLAIGLLGGGAPSLAQAAALEGSWSGGGTATSPSRLLQPSLQCRLRLARHLRHGVGQGRAKCHPAKGWRQSLFRHVLQQRIRHFRAHLRDHARQQPKRASHQQ